MSSRSLPASNAAGPDVAELAALLDQLPAELTRQAFSHSTWVERRIDSYERLAYLGDAVLGLAVSDLLMRELENATAGDLSEIRAQAVSGRACAEVADAFGVADRIAATVPADRHGGHKPRPLDDLLAVERVRASVCESAIGACFLEFGFERTAAAVEQAFAKAITDAIEAPQDFKTVLQERLSGHAPPPRYVTVSETGPAHDREFTCGVEIRGELYGTGQGRSRKIAEQAAAKLALERFDQERINQK